MKNDMCRICSTYWRDDTVHETSESEMSKQETVVRYEHACMGELLYRYRRNRVQDCGMERSDSRYCSVVGCLKRGNESSCFIAGRKFHGYLSHYQLL
jgi:hypothetical protein